MLQWVTFWYAGLPLPSWNSEDVGGNLHNIMDCEVSHSWAVPRTGKDWSGDEERLKERKSFSLASMTLFVLLK